MVIRDKYLNVTSSWPSRPSLHNFLNFDVFLPDGSNQNGSTGCAFTLNNPYFSHKLHPSIFAFTAELFAIRGALRNICEHRAEKSLICSDSQSPIRAIAAHKRGHGVLVEISEMIAKVARLGCICIFLWIPGHWHCRQCPSRPLGKESSYQTGNNSCQCQLTAVPSSNTRMCCKQICQPLAGISRYVLEGD